MDRAYWPYRKIYRAPPVSRVAKPFEPFKTDAATSKITGSLNGGTHRLKVLWIKKRMEEKLL
jgi:hypothetical protein